MKREEEKFRDKYRTQSIRLPGFDYGSPGRYFVTICAKNRTPYFGEIVGEGRTAKMILSPIGEIADSHWRKIPDHFPFVNVREFVVMPDHMHGVLEIGKGGNQIVIPRKNSFGPQSQNLSSIIRGFKASVTKFATLNQLPFAWQSRFFERVIRNDRELGVILDYIRNNIFNWNKDSGTDFFYLINELPPP